MKKILLGIALSAICFSAFSQTDYSGKYSFQENVHFEKDDEIKPGKTDQGPSGDLTLLKIAVNKYKFWLSASRGWPSYNQGTIDGIVDVTNNKAVFKTKFDYAEASCSLTFNLYSNFVQLEQNGTDMDCGFGHAVYADGKYTKKSSKPFTNLELSKQYPGASECKVIAAKSVLYETAGTKQAKKQYFVKGDSILGIDEKNGFMYVEFISSNGKFIYGWLKKSTLSIVAISQD